MIDGVQADSLGPDEESDPLQLALPHVVLEEDVVGEVHAADWLQRSRSLAADWNLTVLGVGGLDPHGLGHWALIVLHPGLGLGFNSVLAGKKKVNSRGKVCKGRVGCNSLQVLRGVQIWVLLQSAPQSVFQQRWSVALKARSPPGSLYTLSLSRLF